MPVLILSDRFDSHADVVIDKLSKQGIPSFRLDLDVESLEHTTISFNGGMWAINTDSTSFCSNDITCVWCRRPFVELSLQEQQIIDVDFRIWKNEWNKTLLGLYNTLKILPWLNPLRKAYKGENKYYQMQIAQEVGFLLPETIISNDKTQLLEFVRKYNKAILKLMAQDIYYVEDVGFRGFYTNIVTENDLLRFNEQSENPIVLQNYIEKKYEIRYTVVGNQHLVCRIDSQQSQQAKYDWRRYDLPHTPHVGITPPVDIQEKVSAFMKKLNLEFGALDFIVTPSNEWYFLEINCMGQWLWIEQLTNLPISDAIVEWIDKHV